jgi:hypothetical protein
MLRALGDRDESAPLRLRFRRMTQRFDRAGGQAEVREVQAFGDLTLAVHVLNMILSTRFYR